MSRDDWFRNTNWNHKIAEAFEAKLKRSRRKGQYLRIQACTLADSQPTVALKLLERYFNEQADRLHDAQAHVDRATALRALGRHEEALAAYEAALTQEAEAPHTLTQAYIELPYLISVRAIRRHYSRAAELLELHRKRLMFPVDFFMWYAARALLSGSSGDKSAARESAKKALEFAAKDESGFRYHPKLGLVSERHNEALRRLREFCDA